MSGRKIKKEILVLLQEPELHAIFDKLHSYHDKDLINPLFSALCRGETSIRWHAVSVFGQVLPRIAEKDIEASRVVMRRFLWSLNDESGGIGWGVPEAMAESMAHSDTLFREYCHMLISYMKEDGPELFQDGNYLELPQLQAGLLWGMGRLASFRKNELLEKSVLSSVVPYLQSENNVVRGLSAWCIGILGAESAKERLAELLEDTSEVDLYLDGVFHKKSVALLAQESLQALGRE